MGHLDWLSVPAFTQAAVSEMLTRTKAVPCASTLQGLLAADECSFHCTQRPTHGWSL